MGMPETPPETVPSARRADGGDAFVTAVRAALPAQGFWTMPVVVAVSGGSDSVALLTTLRRLVPPGLEHRLLVAHAEHDLRDGASADREFVVWLAARLGLH
ncbi:MAG: ATP-binding protein, partial [Planctomycetota bacterium]